MQTDPTRNTVTINIEANGEIGFSVDTETGKPPQIVNTITARGGDLVRWQIGKNRVAANNPIYKVTIALMEEQLFYGNDNCWILTPESKKPTQASVIQGAAAGREFGLSVNVILWDQTSPKARVFIVDVSTQKRKRVK
ncbi:MAG: hypothetical protein ABSF62_10725 [Bryobacteraceae bacterium]|jgi:pyocin large subunit-like protein